MANCDKELILKATTDIFNNFYNDFNSLRVLNSDNNKKNDIISDVFADLYIKISEKINNQ